MLKFRAISPSPQLRSLVQRYMLVEGYVPPGTTWSHMMIPTMMENIFFNLNTNPQKFIVQQQEVFLVDCLLTGQYAQAFDARLTGHVQLMGVHVNTSGLYQLFNVPLKHFVNNTVRLQELIGNDAIFLCQQLQEMSSLSAIVNRLDDFLMKLFIDRNPTPHYTVANALSMIRNSRGKKPIREIALQHKTSERTIQKIFLEHVGVTPKGYSKVYRFNEAVKSMMHSSIYSWRYIVDDLGYYDQAHFINDFKGITGQNPSDYFAGHPEAHRFFADYENCDFIGTDSNHS